jgi:predicted lipoprotein with Yx(FWY)xxD motif
MFAAIAALVAACGGNGSGSTGSGSAGSGSSSAALKTSTSAGLGPVLVDSEGKTLYFTDEESANSIACTGECVGFWRPLTASGNDAQPASGDFTAQFSTVQRPDGKMQVAYNGHPLYTFKLDKSAEQAMGNDFKDDFGGKSFTWHAITPAGVAASQAGDQPSSPAYPDSDGY